MLIIAAALGPLTARAGSAHADDVAYLVNVTVRPGYNFSDAAEAIAYGHGVCEKVNRGQNYADVIRDVKSDFATPDEFEASYLVTQAVGELCPARIWQLRQSAGGYRPPPAGEGQG
ncbi:MAG TPA: DUF732 domain-containing protein [Mycobacterium sp.]|nr:DUF732 domain-containing protein [Mycobacterium sp.]